MCRTATFHNNQSITDYITAVRLRGGIQKFPDWRCKNIKTHHKAYRPPSPSKSFPPA